MLALVTLAVAVCNPVDGGSPAQRDDGGCQPGTHCYTGPRGTEGVGVCRGGLTVCKDDQYACADQVTPTKEICGNAADEDCDGEAAAAPCPDGLIER